MFRQHPLLIMSFYFCSILLVIPGCTTSLIHETTASKNKPLKVWPHPPAKPRIAFVRSFSTASDLGISKNIFSRIWAFVTGSKEWHLVRPMAVLVTKKSLIYIADPGSRAVHRFDINQGQYDVIQIKGNKPFISPVGLAIGIDNEIYVADSSLGHIYVIRPDADVAEQIKLKVPVKQPTGIAVDKSGKQLFIVDTANHHIKVYDLQGSLIKTLGQRGSDDGEFNYPGSIWFDNKGNLLVSDSLNFRIQIIDSKGKFINKFGHHGDGTGDMSRSKGVATDKQGHIYVIDALFHSMQLFNKSGKFLLNVGHRGKSVGNFLLPTGIYITHDNMIYVADSHNKRIQVFRYIGNQP